MPSSFVAPANFSVTFLRLNSLGETGLSDVTSASGSPDTEVEHSVPKYGLLSDACWPRNVANVFPVPLGSGPMVSGTRSGAVAENSSESVGAPSEQLPGQSVVAEAVKVPRTCSQA